MPDVSAWAHEEFGDAELGDQRRTTRLVRLAAAVARTPSALLTRSLASSADREAGYRFVESDRVSVQGIADAMFAASARRCVEHAQVIVAVDQSTLSIVDRKGTKGLGRTGRRQAPSSRRGAEVMSAVARTLAGSTLGVLGQVWHIRSEEPSPSPKQDRRDVEQRESALWGNCLRRAKQAIEAEAPDTRVWFQLDRGADAVHVIETALSLDADFTIRSAQNRCLEDGRRLHDVIRRATPVGRLTANIPDSHAPAGEPRMRRAVLTLRARRVVLLKKNRHGTRKGAVELTVVHALEQARSDRRPRIEWFLLTNVEAKTLDEAARVVQAYRGRWAVEEFHRAWKSGVCDVESSQLRSAGAFMRWATILAAVASRAERLKTLSRAEPDRAASDELTRDEIDAAIVLSDTKRHRIGDELTLHQAVALIAQIGGYTGLKNAGGPPGATVIARGLHDVTVAAAAIAKFKAGGSG